MTKRLRKKGRADVLPHDLMKIHQKDRLKQSHGSKNRIIYDAVHEKSAQWQLSDILKQATEPLFSRENFNDLMGNDYYFLHPNQKSLVPLEYFDEVFEKGSNYFHDGFNNLTFQGKRAYHSPRDFPVPSSILEPIPFEINGSWVESYQFTQGNENYLADIGSDDFYEEWGFSEIPVMHTDTTLPILHKGPDFEEVGWTLVYVLLYRSLSLEFWIEWNKKNDSEQDHNIYGYFQASELSRNLDLMLMHHRYNSQGTETTNETARLAEKNKRFIIRPNMVQKLENTNYKYPMELLKIGPYRNGIVFDFDYCGDGFLHYNWEDVGEFGSEFMSTIFVFETDDSIWFNAYGDIESIKTLIIPKKKIVDSDGNITPQLVRQHIKNVFNLYTRTTGESLEGYEDYTDEEALSILESRDELIESVFEEIDNPMFKYSSDEATICPQILEKLLFCMCGLSHRWDSHTKQSLKELENFWNQVVSTCLNLCIFIQSPMSEPEIRQVSGIQKNPRGGKIRTKLPYRILGKSRVKYVSSENPNPTGEKRSMHLRSGHWRTQPIKYRSGKDEKYIQQKSDGSLWITHWIESTWVNANDDEKVSSQDIALGVTDENKSLAEKRAVEMLREYFPELKHNGRYTWLRNRQGNMLELDIYINQNGIRFAVEMDGEQHYIPTAKFGGREAFRVRKANDKAKDKICREKGIPLIRIRNRDWDMDSESLFREIRNKLPEKMLSVFDDATSCQT
jgi:very-short-patch-repair endonuclease